jgi:hypothetical protein
MRPRLATPPKRQRRVLDIEIADEIAHNVSISTVFGSANLDIVAPDFVPATATEVGGRTLGQVISFLGENRYFVKI